jgi:hypothetical protein
MHFAIFKNSVIEIVAMALWSDSPKLPFAALARSS